MAHTKRIRAIFRGQNGSCGFETNREYQLEVHHNGRGYIQIDGGGRHCDYQSLVSFMNNWDNIRNI